MTVQEMHYAVDQGLQKIGSAVYDQFLAGEIDFWLNRAQERFIKQRLHPVSDPKQLGFSKTIKRLDDLRLVITADYTDGVVPDAAVPFVNFDLPIDYMFLVNARVTMHVSHCGAAPTTQDAEVEREVRIVEQDVAYQHLQNPFAKSLPEAPLTIIFDDTVRVFQGEKFLLKTLHLDYIRTPVQINLSSSIDCELAEHTHHEIVDIAVKTMIEAIESPRYQTTSVEQTQSE